jgi:hypothetical protein
MIKKIVQAWRDFVVKLNERGIPVPTIRDPKTQLGSVSLTMVVVSFGLMSICVVMALCLVVSKWAGFFAAADVSLNSLKEAFWMSFEMSGLSAGLYWSRKFQKDGTKVELSDKTDSESK